MITSQNMLSMPQAKIFPFGRKVMVSRYSSFYIYNHPMIYQICDVIIRVSIYNRQGGFFNIPFEP